MPNFLSRAYNSLVTLASMWPIGCWVIEIHPSSHAALHRPPWHVGRACLTSTKVGEILQSRFLTSPQSTLTQQLQEIHDQHPLIIIAIRNQTPCKISQPERRRSRCSRTSNNGSNALHPYTLRSNSSKPHTPSSHHKLRHCKICILTRWRGLSKTWCCDRYPSPTSLSFLTPSNSARSSNSSSTRPIGR
jgi:hypothetical protein